MNQAPAMRICGPGTFRLFLALMVVVDHIVGFKMGRAAVFLFFVLSGFWIHRMWTERYERTNRPYLTFVASRVWRLMPVMLAATALAVVVQLAVLGRPVTALWPDGLLHTVGSHLFLIGYSDLSEPRLLTPAWSLDVEMQFYLVAPLLIALLRRLRAAAFAAFCAALAGYDMAFGTPAELSALGWFTVGMLVASFGRAPPRWLVVASLMAVAGLLGYVAATDLPLLIDPALNGANRQLNIVLAILAAPIALHTCFCAEDARGRERGNVSYVVYLMHWPLLALGQSSPYAQWMVPLVSVGLLLPLSLAIWRHFDAPIQAARTRWVTGRIHRHAEVPSEPIDARPIAV